MCGIAGFIFTNSSAGETESALARMTAAIALRGPDSDGHWVDADHGVALGHRRLAIVDLSPTGHQPMASASGRFMIVFNGEIYNFAALREELAGTDWQFKGTSDTEVMLAAFEQWGLEASVKRFVGMFAFALWDRANTTLSLVRDRIGEKPLYYGWSGGNFLFGSELKALRAHPDWRGAIDRGAVALLMRHNYVPAPYSIYENVRKLPPGTIVTLDARARGERAMPAPQPYWSMREVADAGARQPFAGSPEEAVDELERLLGESVSRQMMADVPLGAFLSGGVDSSLIVALMQARSQRPVKTFTIGFEEAAYNEAGYAKAVAGHLGTDHTELYVTAEQAMAVIPRLPTMYDEPFADASQIPTFLVSQLARQHVTVSLSGDAGDELFSGYTRYAVTRAVWNKVGRVPPVARRATAALIRSVPPGAWDAGLGWMSPLMARTGRPGLVGDKLHKAAGMLDLTTREALYHRLVSQWDAPSSLVIGADEPPTALTDASRWAGLSDYTQQMAYTDMISYLPDDILVKVDRAAMGVSLETRVPMLDHRVVEFAFSLPTDLKVREGQAKWPLRQILDRHVPRTLIDRPKMGFGVPMGDWLRGPLREWAEALLSEEGLRQEGFFDPRPIREKWAQHLSGRRNWQSHLWDVLMFQAWLDTQSTSPAISLETSQL